jgi:hypothetical protein
MFSFLSARLAFCWRPSLFPSRLIEQDRPADYHFEMAQLAERKKQHLRPAMSLAPGDVDRVLEESDAMFVEAARLAPHESRVFFARAETYIETRRHPEEARKLLRQYIASDSTPDDPPQQAAEKLLRQIPGE